MGPNKTLTRKGWLNCQTSCTDRKSNRDPSIVQARSLVTILTELFRLKVALLWLLRMCLERVGQKMSAEFVCRNNFRHPGCYQCPQPMESASNLPTNKFRHSRPLDINRKLLFVFGATALSGPVSPHSRGFYITHNDAPQSLGPLLASDQLVAETPTWRHTTITTDIHILGGIRTHSLRTRAVQDLRLRPSGHWERQLIAKSRK